MRMWMIDPIALCDKHLRGEHGEIHKHRHNFVKHHRIDGRIKFPAQIVPGWMQARHDILAQEILRRGMNHKSPYVQPDLSYLPWDLRYPQIDWHYNLRDLISRCPDCKERISKYLKYNIKKEN